MISGIESRIFRSPTNRLTFMFDFFPGSRLRREEEREQETKLYVQLFLGIGVMLMQTAKCLGQLTKMIMASRDENTDILDKQISADFPTGCFSLDRPCLIHAQND